MNLHEIAGAGVQLWVIGSWLFAAIHWLRAIQHRAEGVSLTTMLFLGYKSYDPDNFDEIGKRYHRRFMLGVASFLLSLPIMMVAMAISRS